MDELDGGWRLLGGPVHSAHHGLLAYCNVLGLYQSLYIGGGGSRHYSYEAIGGIAIGNGDN